jgi:hypothetical protein
MTVASRKLRYEESHNLYSKPDIIWTMESRRMRWARHVECMEAIRNAYEILVAKPEGKRQLRLLRSILEDQNRT